MPPGYWRAMATNLRVTSTYIEATKGLFSNLPIALFFASIPALCAAVIDMQIVSDQLQSWPPSQEDALKVFIPWAIAALLIEILVGPLTAAAAVFVGKNQAKGQKSSLYKTLNFALNRYKRVFLPHLGATLSIQLGMVVLIPGILFMTMYAFVDPVACLEDEKWAMGRSGRLTRGRRKTILWVAMPLILFSQVAFFIDLAAVEKGTAALFFAYLLSYGLQFWLTLGFTSMYLKRISGRKKQPATQPETTPSEDTSASEG